jgi:hypothetical protein
MAPSNETPLPPCSRPDWMAAGSQLTHHGNCLSSKSKSKLCYDQLLVGQSLLVSSPIWGQRADFCYTQIVACFMKWGALFDKRTDLPIIIIAADPRQCSHFRARVPRTHDHTSLSHIQDSPNLEGQGGPVIPPGTGVFFRSLLRLVGLRWKYSNPPPQRICSRRALFCMCSNSPGLDSFCYIGCYGSYRKQRFQYFKHCWYVCEPLPSDGVLVYRAYTTQRKMSK